VSVILICEPNDDTYALLELVVRRLGHEPLRCDGHLDESTALSLVAELHSGLGLIEPGMPGAFAVAERLHRAGVPLVFASIFPPDEETVRLHPFAHLVKPFPLQLLQRALADALSERA
jgi:CheY-like chemotaxis protein